MAVKLRRFGRARAHRHGSPGAAQLSGCFGRWAEPTTASHRPFPSMHGPAVGCSSKPWHEVLIPPPPGTGPLASPSIFMCLFSPACCFCCQSSRKGARSPPRQSWHRLITGHLEVLGDGWGCSQPGGTSRAWLGGLAPLPAEMGVPGSRGMPASCQTGPHGWGERADTAHTQAAF